jgi:hypothetical protein
MKIHPSKLKSGDVFIASFNAASITCVENYVQHREGLTVIMADSFTWLSLRGVTKVTLLSRSVFSKFWQSNDRAVEDPFVVHLERPIGVVD